MSNILYIPRINPVTFYEIMEDGTVPGLPFELPFDLLVAQPAQPDKYLTKHYDDFAYRFTLQPWEEKVCYCQKMMKVDFTPLQFISNYDPIQVDLLDTDGRVIDSVGAVQKRQNKSMPTYYAYEATINWSLYPVGIYFLQLTTAGMVTMISEPINLAVVWPNTLNFEYRNGRYHADVIFETGIRFSFRVEGNIGRILPGSNDQYYEDQKLNPTLISSKTFNAFKLSIGGTFGIPDYVIEKMNLIWSCNDVMIDGKSHAKSSDGKFTYNEESLYPMRGIEMEIREGINRTSKVVSNSFNTNKKLVVQYNISSRIFGGLGNDQTIVVTAFE